VNEIEGNEVGRELRRGRSTEDQMVVRLFRGLVVCRNIRTSCFIVIHSLFCSHEKQKHEKQKTENKKRYR
jgi:hypothetical protein